MNLDAQDIEKIEVKLNKYSIKYQEIYDEIKDHLISAIEDLRAKGDNRDIDVLFKEVVKTQFPGYTPFEAIVRQYGNIYRSKLGKALWTGMKDSVNWKTIPVLIALVLLGFYLPPVKPNTAVVAVGLFIVALVPILFGYFSTRKIKTDKGRKSLVKNYVMAYSAVLMQLINVLFTVIGQAVRHYQPLAFLDPWIFTPVFMSLLLGFYFIYGLGCIKMVQEEVQGI